MAQAILRPQLKSAFMVAERLDGALLRAEKAKNTSSKSQGKLDEPHQEAQEDSKAAEVVPQQWRVATKIP